VRPTGIGIGTGTGTGAAAAVPSVGEELLSRLTPTALSRAVSSPRFAEGHLEASEGRRFTSAVAGCSALLVLVLVLVLVPLSQVLLPPMLSDRPPPSPTLSDMLVPPTVIERERGVRGPEGTIGSARSDE